MNAPPAQPLQLTPQLRELTTLTAYLETFAEANDISAGDTMAFTLAAEELFANTLHHSTHRASSIEFSLRLSGDRLTAVYSDDASPFDPTATETPDTAAPAEDRAIGGLGLHLVRKMMSEFRYQRDGERNVLTFGRIVQFN